MSKKKWKSSLTGLIITAANLLLVMFSIVIIVGLCKEMANHLLLRGVIKSIGYIINTLIKLGCVVWVYLLMITLNCKMLKKIIAGRTI